MEEFQRIILVHYHEIAADTKPLSMAFNEIARGEVSYDPESIDVKNH